MITSGRSTYPLWQSPCSHLAQWKTGIHRRWRRCSVTKTEKLSNNPTQVFAVHQWHFYVLSWYLREESENIIQLRIEHFEGFEEAVLVPPQQLSHGMGVKQTFACALQVGGYYIGRKKVILEPLHHRLPGRRKEYIVWRTIKKLFPWVEWDQVRCMWSTSLLPNR